MKPLLIFLALLPALVRAAEPPIPAAERTQMLAAFIEKLATLNAAIAKSADDEQLYSQRGDCHLFLAHFPEAVADFEKMIALDPALDAPHWRLGIAYYFAGKFAESSRQFARYHDYDGRDRENGLWKFLADAKLGNVESARRSMLTYTRFDREPFPALYALFAGEKSTADFFAELKQKNLGDDSAPQFYANYYAALNEALLGHLDIARPLLAAAVASKWARAAEAGPAYMWQIARLHFDQLTPAAP